MPSPHAFPLHRRAIAPVLLAIAIGTAGHDAHALPSFARTTGLACSACHAGGPRLQTLGMRFLARGYRLPEAPASAARAPLSVIATAGWGRADPAPVDEFGGTRERTSALEIHLAGATGPGWSWHLAQRVGTTNGTLETRVAVLGWQRSGIDQAWGVRAGRYEVGLPFLVQSRRPTLAPYRVPVSFMAEGVELTGTRGPLNGAAGVTEDARTPAPGTRVSGFGAHLQDPYFWIAAGGERLSLGGRMWFDRQDSDLPFHTWLQHMQHEVAARVRCGRIEMTPAYVLDRYDDRPAAELHDKHHMAMVELDAPVDPVGRWWVTARAEHEYRPGTPFTPEHDRADEALDLAFVPRPELRFALEWTQTTDNRSAPRDDQLAVFARASY